MHLRRRGVVVGVVIGAEEAALAEEAFLVAALALRVGLGVEVGVSRGVELGDEGARRQRDDARANSAKRLFLEGTSSRARSAAGAYFLLDDERAEVSPYLLYLVLLTPLITY